MFGEKQLTWAMYWNEMKPHTKLILGVIMFIVLVEIIIWKCKAQKCANMN